MSRGSRWVPPRSLRSNAPEPTSIYIGIALYARSMPAFTLLPIVLALLDRLVVSREEAYLERRFGDDYRHYRDAVPRWF